MVPKTPLVHPQRYFEAHLDPLIPGLSVFALNYIGAILLLYAVIRLLLARTENVPPQLVGAFRDILITTVVIGAIVALIGLLVVAAIMHYLGGGADAESSFTDTVSVAAWSYAPELISVPIMYLVARIQLAEFALDATDPQRFINDVEAIEGATGVPGILVSLGVVAWSVFILAKGTAGVHAVDLQRTILPALLIGIGSLVLRLT